MGLFTREFYRSFAIGFGAGALLLALTLGSGNLSVSGNLMPDAVAADAAH